MKIVQILCAAALSLITVAARADEPPMAIGAIYLDAQGYYAGVRKGVQDGARDLGRPIRIVETNAQDDPSKESSFVDTLIAANVKAILLSAVSAQGSVRTVRRAHEAGIPVVCYNTCVDDAAMRKYVYAYVIGDPVEFGAKLGAAAADYFSAAHIAAPKIGVVNCEFVEVCIHRREGFMKALLAKVPGARIVDNQKGTTLDASLSVSEQMLTAHPDLDAFFGESGGATLGAAKAVHDRGRVGHIVVFGSDMTTEIAQELEEHSVLKAVVDISGQAVGRLAIRQAVDAVEGRKNPDILVPASIELYATPDEARGWLKAHPDGIP